MHDIRERNKFEWFTIWIDSLYFFRTTLRHFEGDKNQLVELDNKTTIAAQCGIIGPEESFLNLIQQEYI